MTSVPPRASEVVCLRPDTTEQHATYLGDRTPRAWRLALLEGTMGSDARVLGGALLPLHAHFAPDRDLLLKVT